MTAQYLLEVALQKSIAVAAAQKQRGRPTLECGDCGVHAFSMDYMVHDHVWAAGGLQKNALCCPRCLERRLGRRLGPDDLPPVVINSMLLFGMTRGTSE